MKPQREALDRFTRFISERNYIRIKREAGQSKPWTTDPILQKYRFCNVQREHDKVTRWIAENLRNPVAEMQLWERAIEIFAAARFINRIQTLDLLRNELLNNGWSRECVRLLRRRYNTGEPIITGAYMVKTQRGLDKVAGLDVILKPFTKNRLSIWHFQNLQMLHNYLLQYKWVGSFISAQIIADLKYLPPLMNLPDWWTFAASGPGSRRGLNRLFGRELEAPWKEEEWHEHLTNLRMSGFGFLHAQDLQNCCCEFDKYERTRLGQGEPKQRYPGV